jgi:poly(3-hydroxybutyrate) depolymerase
MNRGIAQFGTVAGPPVTENFADLGRLRAYSTYRRTMPSIRTLVLALLGLAGAAFTAAPVHAQGGSTCTAAINEYFVTPTSGTYFGAAQPVNINGFTRLRLVQDGVPNSTGTWVSAPIPGTVKEFTASFRFSVRNSNGGAGDGFSFLWGNLSNTTGTRMAGGEWGLQGFNNDQAGLSVGFVTYAGAGANGVNGKWGGSQFAFLAQSFTPVTWVTTTQAVDRTRMATATVYWSRGTGTRVTLAFPGYTASTMYIDKGAQQMANINPTGWSFGFAGRNGSIDQDVYIGEVQISAVVECPDPRSPADINRDCVVNGADLAAVLSAWGPCSTTPCTGDFDGNGIVNGSDIAAILGAWGSAGCVAQVSSDRLTMRPLGTTTAQQGFWEYLPAGYAARNDWPLLVCLHGIGEDGNGTSTDLPKLLGNGVPPLIKANAWPVAASTAGDAFVVLAPQNARGGCHVPTDVDAFLQWAAANYHVDRSRIYLTGLSCGGIGTWEYLRTVGSNALPAAVVPICGDGTAAWNERGCLLGLMPIWAFHGDADGTIPVSGSIIPLTGIQGCQSPAAVDARLTIYPGVGHDSWTQTYNLSSGNDIYAWLLTHRRTTP